MRTEERLSPGRDRCWEEPKYRDFHGYLYTTNDGTMDVEGFIDSLYGSELARRLGVRFAIESDEAAAREYYRSVGLDRQLFDIGDYYSRWSLLTPLDASLRGPLPLVFWLHGAGNSIEAEECMMGFAQLAAREGFMLAVPQNTNPEKLLDIIGRVAEMRPLDRSRIYLAGFSQGGEQCHGAYFRHPELFAAAVTCGNGIWRPWDNMQVDYTEAEIERVRRLRVPLMQLCGQCEPFSYAPLSDFRKRPFPPPDPWGRPDTADIPGKDDELDPTRIHDPSKGRFDPIFDDERQHNWRMAKSYEPGPGEDVGLWSLARVNFRMGLLDCEPRDVNTCLGFRSLHQDEVRRVCGVYGDYEAVEYHYGYRHYTVGIDDRSGVEMYRFVCVQNSPHWPPLATGELGWSFLRRFRRGEDGMLISEEVQA